MYLNEVKVLRKSFKKNNVTSDECGVHVSVQISSRHGSRGSR